MHEHDKGREAEKLAFVNRGIGWNRIPAVHERNKLDTTTHLYIYDRGAWTSRTYFSYKELTHRLAIIITSTAAFGTGLGVFIKHLLGGW